DFVKKYTSRFNKAPGAMAALGYDGILVIADAFKRAGSSEANALTGALASTAGFKGVSGVMTMNQQRDAEKEAVVLKTEGDKAVFAAKVAPGGGNKKSH